MKTDLASSIGLAIVGVIVAYFICNILVGSFTTGDYTVKTIETEVSADITDPDPSIFNYRALNPTVEVYVGNCKEFNSDGQCIDNDNEDINQDIIDNVTPSDSSDDEDSNPNSDSQNDNKESDSGNRSPSRKEE
jgi:hypothetical protein